MGQESSSMPIQHEQISTQTSTLNDSIISTSSQLEEGIIQVVKQTDEDDEDEELKLLRSLKKFEPFIKDNDKGFSIESLLGMKTNSKPTVSTHIMQDTLADPVIDMFTTLKSYIKENMSHINMEQRLLFKRIAYVNELSTTCNSIMTKAHNQSKLAADKIIETAILKEQAVKAQEHAAQLFKSLSSLEKYLDPEDRIATNIESKWPELNTLRAQALKSLEHPSIERYISSTSELTTVVTSTSPLLDNMMMTGEPVKEEALDNPRTVNQRSMSTSSLALDKLRGLSYQSIYYK